MALREFCTPEQIKRATMHITNRAFERYYMIEAKEVLEVYKRATPKELKAKVLEFRRE